MGTGNAGLGLVGRELAMSADPEDLIQPQYR